MRLWTFASSMAVAAVLAVIAVPFDAASATLEQRCTAAKLKAITKRISGGLRCESRSMLLGELQTDPACLQKVDSKFADALAKAEALTECEGDSRTVSASIESCVQGIVDPVAPRIVPVWFHVIHNGSAASNLSESVIFSQLEVLNDAFAGRFGGANTGYQFELAGITRTQNSEWYTMGNSTSAEYAAKAALHQGDAATLNVYTANIGGGNLGWSSWPADYANNPSRDGVVLLYSTVPGGSAAPYNQGKTLVRETGRWFGLLLTSQGTCENAGDLVDDTPPQDSPAFGCPSERDTCPGDSKFDPIGNFMDYVDDSCMNEFTAGQADRMDAQWDAYRDGTPLP